MVKQSRSCEYERAISGISDSWRAAGAGGGGDAMTATTDASAGTADENEAICEVTVDSNSVTSVAPAELMALV